MRIPVRDSAIIMAEIIVQIMMHIQIRDIIFFEIINRYMHSGIPRLSDVANPAGLSKLPVALKLFTDLKIPLNCKIPYIACISKLMTIIIW